jgi:hypothetical protein
MKIEINKEEYYQLLVGMQIYKERLKNNLINGENYISDYDSKEMLNSISYIDNIINKLIKKRNGELNNEKI